MIVDKLLLLHVHHLLLVENIHTELGIEDILICVSKTIIKNIIIGRSILSSKNVGFGCVVGKNIKVVGLGGIVKDRISVVVIHLLVIHRETVIKNGVCLVLIRKRVRCGWVLEDILSVIIESVLLLGIVIED